jgi:hypothetical protein
MNLTLLKTRVSVCLKTAWAVLVLCPVLCVGCGGEVELLPPPLETLPTGLKVTVSPPVVEAQRGGPSSFEYTWTFSVLVESTTGPVQIEQYGYFDWVADQWVFGSGRPFGPADFAKAYHCKGGMIMPGTVYECAENWRGDDNLQAFRSKWYFVGVDARGRRVKGESIVELLPRVKER